MKIANEVDKLLELMTWQRASSHNIVDISPYQVREGALVLLTDHVFLVANGETCIAWAQFATHCNSTNLHVKSSSKEKPFVVSTSSASCRSAVVG